MAFTKISNAADYTTNNVNAVSSIDSTQLGVQGLSDRPNLSATNMKAKFDEIAKTLLAPFINKHITELEAKTAAANIGANDINGSASTVQSELEKRPLATNVPTNEEMNTAIDQKVKDIGAGDMSKAEYDHDNSGVVDNSKKLGGQLPAYYATAESLAKINTITVSLPASGWTGTAAPYTQTVTVEGMTADWVPGIPMLTSSGVVATDLAMREALYCVSLIESSAGALTFACYEDKPTADINAKIPGVI